MVAERLEALRAYIMAVDTMLGAISQGAPMTSTRMHEVATQRSPRTAADNAGAGTPRRR